jgi:hypothetical protein
MVHVVFVLVLMLRRFMTMGVCVLLAQVQPYPDRHQRTGEQKSRRYGFAEQDDRQQGAEERRHREVRAGARSAQMAQCHDKQHQADAIGEEAQHGRPGQHAGRRQAAGSPRAPAR